MPSPKELVGIGVDAVSWNRVKRFLEEHPLESVERLLSNSERKIFRMTSEPLSFLARAFAAKEAYFKAANGVWLNHPVGFREIEIIPEEESRFHVACDFETEGEFFEMPEGLGARVMIWSHWRHCERSEAISDPRLLRRPLGSSQ